MKEQKGKKLPEGLGDYWAILLRELTIKLRPILITEDFLILE